MPNHADALFFFKKNLYLSFLLQASESFCDPMREVFEHVDLAHDSLTEDLDVETR